MKVESSRRTRAIRGYPILVSSREAGDSSHSSARTVVSRLEIPLSTVVAFIDTR